MNYSFYRESEMIKDDEAFVEAVEDLSEMIMYHPEYSQDRIDIVRVTAQELHQDHPSLADSVSDIGLALCQELGIEEEFNHISYED
jgi:hypothetical protein